MVLRYKIFRQSFDNRSVCVWQSLEDLLVRRFLLQWSTRVLVVLEENLLRN